MKIYILLFALFSTQISSSQESVEEPRLDLSMNRSSGNSGSNGCGSVSLQGKYKRCSLFRLIFETADQVPDVFRRYIVSINGHELKGSAKTSVLVLIENDNLEVIGLAKALNIPVSDDFGMTHRMMLAVQKIVDDTKIEYSYQTTLYTSPIGRSFRDSSGTLNRSQHFENEVILKVLIDNIPKGNVQFWSAEVGFIGLSSELTSNFMDASSQQAALHSFVNSINPGKLTEFNHVEDGSKDRWGVFVGAFIGLQKRIRLSQNTQINFQTDVGARVSSFSDASYIQASGQTELVYGFQNAGRIKLKMGLVSQLHNHGVGHKTSGGLAFETRNGTDIGITVIKNNGELLRNSRYNRNNVLTGRPDATWLFYFRKPIN